jgi:hypothetical protein
MKIEYWVAFEIVRLVHLRETPCIIHIILRSNEILGWEGVGNRQLLCFFKRRLIGAC